MADSLFKVRLKDLPANRRIEVDGPFVARTLSGLALREALEPPPDDPDAGAGVAVLDLYTDADLATGRGHVFASGSVEGWLTVACGRCVGPVRIPVSEKLHVTFAPKAETDAAEAKAKANEDAEGEVELAADDLDVFPYEGDIIDLEPLIREQFVLSVPFAPLCKEDCKGLCQTCGIDRNTGTCSCEKPIDPRFAALEALRKGLKPTP
jgi:uncharacterized protein